VWYRLLMYLINDCVLSLLKLAYPLAACLLQTARSCNTEQRHYSFICTEFSRRSKSLIPHHFLTKGIKRAEVCWILLLSLNTRIQYFASTTEYTS